MVIEILKATYLENYTISFHFSDGLIQVIDFEKFLLSSANNMTKKFLNKSLFKDFSIQYGDIVWNDYELCFPIWDLHQGQL